MSIPDTINGYNSYDVMSALQKCIRRGVEYDAGFWAMELCDTGASHAGICWNRLQVIACEDVGPGDPNAIAIVTSCRDIWERLSKKKGSTPESNILLHAVLYLCRANKSREADALGNILNWKRRGLDPTTRENNKMKELLPIPEIAQDGHTFAGKQKYKKIAAEKGVSPMEIFVKDFRERTARVNKPVQSIGHDGVNWTYEACKLEGSSVDKAMEAAETLDA